MKDILDEMAEEATTLSAPEVAAKLREVITVHVVDAMQTTRHTINSGCTFPYERERGRRRQER